MLTNYPQSTTGGSESQASIANLEHLAKLTALPQWVCWRLEPNPEEPSRPKKMPYDPRSGQRAKANDPTTWGTFSQAVAAFERNPSKYNGIGFEFAAGGGLVGVDFDGCRDPETGTIDTWVLDWVQRLGTYTEVSQSGRGLHCIGQGALPPGGRKKGSTELYDEGRFFALTGNLLPGAPLAINDCGEAIDALHRETFGTAPSHTGSTLTATGQASGPSLDDVELLERARAAHNGGKFDRLWHGDLSDYASDQSAADLGLCNLLAFWTGPDPDRIDRLYRQSGLYRAKWDEPHYASGETYGVHTIAKALASCTEFYSGNGHNEPSKLPPKGAATEKPRINAGVRDLEAVSKEAWNAIVATNNPPYMFLHAGRPVRLEHDRKGHLVLRELTPERLRHEADRAAVWYRREKAGDGWAEVDAAPPKDVVADMLAFVADEMPLPNLERIAQSPTFAPDGTLLCENSYHPASGTLVRLTVRTPHVPTEPADTDVAQALGLIQELIGDFPFEAEADRTHAVALMILPFVRDLIQGPTPLHLIEAPAPGSGKGLLASALLLPATGGDVGLMTQGRDEDEWRKRITTRLQEGKAAILIDNVNRPLESGTLSSALTAWPLWGDRQLGTLEALNVPARCTWVATANNPTLSTEIARRAIRIRLNARIDRPWERDASNFRHPDLLRWAREHRSELIWGALVLVQSWLAAGRPLTKARPLGSYEIWTEVIGGILEHAGFSGFLSNLSELYEQADAEGAVWRRFVQAWWEEHHDNPVGVAELFPLAQELEDFDLGHGVTERAQKTVLGKALGKRRDMVIGDYTVVRAGVQKRATLWRLLKTAGK